jgi:N-acetylglucosaminylphosphatidylinositol deacetylase
MFAFVMDDLLNLEKRLLDIVDDIESRTGEQQSRANVGFTWTFIPQSWQGGKSSVAVSWLGVRTKALELVRQREALTARVQFLQMSMVSSRLRDLESYVRVREAAEERRAVVVRSAVEAQALGIKELQTRMRLLFKSNRPD